MASFHLLRFDHGGILLPQRRARGLSAVNPDAERSRQQPAGVFCFSVGGGAGPKSDVVANRLWVWDRSPWSAPNSVFIVSTTQLVGRVFIGVDGAIAGGGEQHPVPFRRWWPRSPMGNDRPITFPVSASIMTSSLGLPQNRNGGAVHGDGDWLAGRGHRPPRFDGVGAGVDCDPSLVSGERRRTSLPVCDACSGAPPSKWW